MSSYHDGTKVFQRLPFHYFLIASLLLGFFAGYIAAQKRNTHSTAWSSGWVVLAKTGSSPDPGIYGDTPLYDSIVRKDIEVGFRADGVVVWRKIDSTEETVTPKPQ